MTRMSLSVKERNMSCWGGESKELGFSGSRKKERARRRQQLRFRTYRAKNRQPAATRKRFPKPERKNPPDSGTHSTHASSVFFCFPL